MRRWYRIHTMRGTKLERQADEIVVDSRGLHLYYGSDYEGRNLVLAVPSGEFLYVEQFDPKEETEEE